MLDFDCTSKFSNGKNAATKAQIQNFAENQHFWQLLSRNVETAFMAQHFRKDCGHLRVFLLKHLFCHVFPISQWWVGGPANIILRTPLSELVCISQEKECRNYFRRRQKVMKKNQRIIQVCNARQVILKNCGFVRLPVFGIISGPHLERVQRFLFVLFQSHFLAQAVSSGRFSLKKSDFWPGQIVPGLFLKKLPPKPESSFRLKNFIFGRLLSGILHKKGLASKSWLQDQHEISHFSKFA